MNALEKYAATQRLVAGLVKEAVGLAKFFTRMVTKSKGPGRAAMPRANMPPLAKGQQFQKGFQAAKTAPPVARAKAFATPRPRRNLTDAGDAAFKPQLRPKLPPPRPTRNLTDAGDAAHAANKGNLLK